MAKVLRPDLVFSYWIYVWFLLYFFQWIKYSPKFAVILGLLDNIIMFLLMILFGTNMSTIINFVIINTIIKIIPLYYLRKERIIIKDIYFTCILFLFFVIWIHMNKQTLVGNLKIVHDSLLYGENRTPLMNIVSKIKKNFKFMN
jgi:hypothetical protein